MCRKSIPNFVAGELSFLKLGMVLVSFSGGGVELFLKANIATLEVSCEFCPVDWI